MIKYLGSKRTLIPLILEAVEHSSQANSVIDLFSGTSRVGHALKALGYQVFANDHNAYAATLARCYVEADIEDVEFEASQLVSEFNHLPGKAGYFTETFCEHSRFFQPKNGERIDAIREEILAKALRPELEAVMLVSLMEAADRVDSTTGVQMAYLKQWAKRSFNDLELRLPNVLPRAKGGKGRATELEAAEACRQLQADVAYIDPPYNQHSYLRNYHIWESLVLWDKPQVYGVACKRMDCKERVSSFNSRVQFAEAMTAVFRAIRAQTLVVSFSNEGYISREMMEGLLREFTGTEGEVVTIQSNYKRYVGAQIGIYNPQGTKVGITTHTRNVEFVYIASKTRIPEVVKMRERSELAAAPLP